MLGAMSKSKTNYSFTVMMLFKDKTCKLLILHILSLLSCKCLKSLPSTQLNYYKSTLISYDRIVFVTSITYSII